MHREKGKRIESLKFVLQRVAGIATTLEPSGISVRFLNYPQDGKFDNLADMKDIEDKIRKVQFKGDTKLGRVLASKIVEPMVIRKANSGEFKKPLFVVIITDGQVSLTSKDAHWMYSVHGNTHVLCGLP